MKKHWPSRRGIHLDFHNAEFLPDIAADFDAEAFASTMVAADVDSVTVFAKCHHGLSYHPTDVGRIHPALLPGRDLVGEQIAALHGVGIRAPIYISVCWDELMADLHPEWRLVDEDGRYVGKGESDVYGWRMLDIGSAYADYVLAQTEEVLRRYAPVDGVFFDIVRQDPDAPEAERDFMARASALVESHSAEATVFFNSRLRPDRDPRAGSRDELAWQSHVEVESLASGEWGYHHYPLFSSYFQSLGHPMLGMTGIFHKSWADFGGLKPEAALRYECARMLAAGAWCSIGDQLHPRGALEPAAYERIGAVYARVRALEPWLEGASAVPEVGVLLAETGPRMHQVGREIDEGAMRMLLEDHRCFQFVDREADLSRYQVLVAPDDVPFDASLASRVAEYLESGGTLLLTHRAGLGADGTFAVDVGVDHVGASPETPEYLMAERAQVLYEPGSSVRPHPDTEVLYWLGDPYFTRTHDKYTSHAHAAYEKTTSRPAVTRRGNVIYCANPLFTAYRRHAVPHYRQLVGALLDQLAPDRLVTSPDLPTTAEVSVMRQADRMVVHLIHAVPQRRGRDIEIVEDVLPLNDVRLGVRAGSEVARVYLAPEGTELPHETIDGVTWVTVPRVAIHQVVVFE